MFDHHIYERGVAQAAAGPRAAARGGHGRAVGRAGRHQRVAAAAPQGQRVQPRPAAVRGATVAARLRHLLVGLRLARTHHAHAAT